MPCAARTHLMGSGKPLRTLTLIRAEQSIRLHASRFDKLPVAMKDHSPTMFGKLRPHSAKNRGRHALRSHAVALAGNNGCTKEFAPRPLTIGLLFRTRCYLLLWRVLTRQHGKCSRSTGSTATYSEHGGCSRGNMEGAPEAPQLTFRSIFNSNCLGWLGCPSVVVHGTRSSRNSF